MSELSIWSAEKRAEMAVVLSDWVNAAEESKTGRMVRWDRARAMYQNEPIGESESAEGGEGNAFNLIQVKVDGIISNIVSPVMMHEPYCYAQSYGLEDDQKEALEEACQFFAERANLSLAIADVGLPAAQCGRGFIRCEYKDLAETGTVPRLCFEVLEPYDVVVYPAMSPDLHSAKMFGWRFQRSREEIEMLQASGQYLPSEIIPSADDSKAQDGYSEISEAGKPPAQNAVKSGEDLIDLHTIVFWDYTGKTKRRLWATLDAKSRIIYWVKPYPFKRSLNLCEFHFKTISPKDGFWPANSIAQDLQGHQIDVNRLTSIMMAGAEANTLGYHFTDGIDGLDPKEQVVRPGGIHSWPGAKDIVSHYPRTDISALPTLIGMYVENADRVVRLSQMGTGGDAPKGQTATATSIAAAGQAAGKDDYASRFTRGLTDVFGWMQEALELNYNDWYPVVSSAFSEDARQVMTPDLFAQFVDWDVAVTSTNNNPGTQLATAQLMLEIASGVPGGKIKVYDLVKRILQLAERTGFTNADRLQAPEDPIEVIAMALVEAGVPEDIAIAAANTAIDTAEEGTQLLVELSGMGGNQGVPTGGPTAGATEPGDMQVGGPPLPTGSGASVAGTY